VAKTRRWPKSRTRLLTWVIVGTLILLAGTLVYTYLAYQEAAAALLVERDRELNYLSASRLKDEMTNFADILTSLARTPEIYSGRAELQRQGLQDGRLRLAVFDAGVVLLDNFGVVQAAQPERPEVIGEDWSDRAYFRDLLGEEARTAYSDIVADGEQGAEVVVLSVPITGARGEFVGALAGMFRIGEPTVSSLYASILRLRLLQGGHTRLVDGQGRVIYDSDAEGIGKTLDSLVPYLLEAQAGAQARRTRDAQGHAIVAASAPVPGTSWRLVSEDDWTILNRDTRRYGQRLVIVLAIAIVFPAVGVALLVRQQNVEALERQQIEHELSVARVIQQTLLPKNLPDLPGWEVAVHYQPARAVGGDFYDFVPLPDGRLMLCVGDVTDKGVPAALIMATTRATLRGTARRMLSPGQALSRSNSLLHPEMPSSMFVTCLYAVLDPQSGILEFANAGHNLPQWARESGTSEILCRGMPLGLMPDSVYEQRQIAIGPNDLLLLYSDGLTEAHSPRGEMFGVPRLKALVEQHQGGSGELVRELLAALAEFTGPGWAQEDDVTLLSLQRKPTVPMLMASSALQVPIQDFGEVIRGG